MLIDDNPTDAILVAAALHALASPQFQVSAAPTLDRGLSDLRASSYDAILLDLSLPDGEGLDTVRRTHAAAPSVPIVVFTGRQDAALEVAVLQHGAQDYVVKNPDFDGVVLARTLRFAIERSNLQREVMNQTLLHQALLQAQSDLGEGTVVINAVTAQIERVNAALCLIFGHSEAEMLALPSFYDLVDPAARDRQRDLVQRRLRGSQFSETYELAGRHQNGARIDLQAAARPLDSNTPRRLVVVMRDVTELKRAQTQMLLADRMASVGTLASGVAHEINNPLAYITGNLAFISEQLDDIAVENPHIRLQPVRECLRDTADGTARVARIVADLKSFSRVDEDVREAVDVRQVLETSLNIAGSQIRQRAALVLDFAPVPAVVGNASRLAQVFVNLLINAAQAIPQDDPARHEITVCIRSDRGARVVVSIADTGAGIPPHLLGRVFDPFFTTKAVGVGTGLGLAICHGILAAMGAEIQLVNRSPRGCLATVILHS